MSDSSGATSLGRMSVNGNVDGRSGGTGGDHNKGHSHNSGEPDPASAAMPTEYVIGIQNLITAEEGRYSYPYRDSTGNATWGIGHKFNSMTDFVAFPWIVAKTGQPATKEEKIAAWNSLMSIHKNDNNYKATSYSGVTGYSCLVESLIVYLHKTFLIHNIKLQNFLEMLGIKCQILAKQR